MAGPPLDTIAGPWPHESESWFDGFSPAGGLAPSWQAGFALAGAATSAAGVECPPRHHPPHCRCTTITAMSKEHKVFKFLKA